MAKIAAGFRLAGRAGRAAFQYMAQPNPKAYVRGVMVGGVLLDIGARSLEHARHEATHEQGGESSSSKNTAADPVHAHIEKSHARVNQLTTSDAVSRHVSGYAPSNWVLPGRKVAEKAFGVVRYGHRVQQKEFIADGQELAGRIANKEWEKIKNAPSELLKIPGHIRTADAYRRGAADEGGEKLAASFRRETRAITAAGIRDIGMNVSARGLASLIPGIPGIAIRAFLTAKTIGNAGRTMQKVSELGKGPHHQDLHDVIAKRNQTIAAREKTHS